MDLLLIMAFLSAIYTAYLTLKTNKSKQSSAEKRHAIMFPEFKHDFFRINTNEKLGTTIHLNDGVLAIHTDIHSIEIVDESLRLVVQSKCRNAHFRFAIMIAPFDTMLFSLEKYEHFSQKGVCVLGEDGNATDLLLQELLETYEKDVPVYATQDNIGFDIAEFTIDPAEDKIIVAGLLLDGSSFSIQVFHKSFRVKMSANMGALMNADNFVEYEFD